jgi:hypothetical protein
MSEVRLTAFYLRSLFFQNALPSQSKKSPSEDDKDSPEVQTENLASTLSLSVKDAFGTQAGNVRILPVVQPSPVVPPSDLDTLSNFADLPNTTSSPSHGNKLKCSKDKMTTSPEAPCSETVFIMLCYDEPSPVVSNNALPGTLSLETVNNWRCSDAKSSDAESQAWINKLSILENSAPFDVGRQSDVEEETTDSEVAPHPLTSGRQIVVFRSLGWIVY